MSYKLIIFDLDGVLLDAKMIHYQTLNDAIFDATKDRQYCIKWEEHLSTYDGLKTREKLERLSYYKKLPTIFHEKIWITKQELTANKLLTLKERPDHVTTLQSLRDEGYKLACCSNSIRRTVLVALSKLNLMQFMDYVISNEDVKNGKPHPEMYWKAMSAMGVLPEETLIVEDSPPGLAAAARSRAHVLRVDNPSDLTLDKIHEALSVQVQNKIPKWKGNKMNVLIPMAGAGSRFEKAGYTFPKPLIDVNGKPMIQIVVENLNIEADYIFIVQKSHRSKYNLDTLLNMVAPGCKIVEVDGITEGAACTTLLAKEHIDNNKPLLIANSDQFVEWDSNEFMYKMIENQADGGLVVFTATHPKWSFAKVNEIGLVTEVAEKNPISDIATVGIYYWRKGSEYVRCAEQMIQKNIRVNNEFYICPVYNEAIQEGKEIRTYPITNMWGLGTPEDLSHFVTNYSEST